MRVCLHISSSVIECIAPPSVIAYLEKTGSASTTSRCGPPDAAGTAASLSSVTPTCLLNRKHLYVKLWRTTIINYSRRWHHLLKGKFLEGKRYRRVDHVLHVLINSAIPCFIAKHRCQDFGFEGPDLEVKRRMEVEFTCWCYHIGIWVGTNLEICQAPTQSTEMISSKCKCQRNQYMVVNVFCACQYSPWNFRMGTLVTGVDPISSFVEIWGPPLNTWSECFPFVIDVLRSIFVKLCKKLGAFGELTKSKTCFNWWANTWLCTLLHWVMPSPTTT
jgi:hypothetical protein